MTYQTITLDISGDLAALTFMRPAVLNALSPALLAEAVHAVEAVGVSNARVLVVSGAGRAFSAGADLKALSDPGFSREDGRAFQANAERLTHLLETIAQVTIAKVHGACFTGGLEIALACDLLVAADEARFADTHAAIGFRPMWGMTQRLPRRIGIQRARELSFTARRIDGAEAARIGLALESVAGDLINDRVAALAAAIAGNNRGSIAAFKSLYHDAQNHHLDAGVRHEADARFRIARG